jgi:hypothetical protein
MTAMGMFGLLVLNGCLAFGAYERGSYKVAMFSSFAAGSAMIVGLIYVTH